MEQRERQVFELLDLGYGRCRMVLATVDGEPDPAAEALRRLGVHARRHEVPAHRERGTSRTPAARPRSSRSRARSSSRR